MGANLDNLLTLPARSWRELFVRQKLARKGEGPSKRQCMHEGCKNPPEVECIWADGRGRAWHCQKHHDVWVKDDEAEAKKNDLDYLPLAIVKQRKVPNGVVGDKYGEYPESKTADAKDGKTTGYRDSVGLFIRVPEHLASQFPSLGDEDRSPPHITFLYIGDVKPEQDPTLFAVVNKVFSEGLPTIKARIAGLEYFEHPNKLRSVAHVGVNFSRPMSEIRTRLRSALEDAGFNVQDSFPIYRPHITLEYLDGLGATYDGPVPKGEWEFNEIEIWGLPQEHRVSFHSGGLKTAANKYDHINFTPPESVASEAAKGLEYRAKQGEDKAGLTPSEAAKEGIGSGVQRATNLKNRDKISPKVIRQMVGFFSRHEKNKSIDAKFKNEPWKDKGYVSWLLWGGDAGRAWAEKILKQMEAADERSKTAFVAEDGWDQGGNHTVVLWPETDREAMVLRAVRNAFEERGYHTGFVGNENQRADGRPMGIEIRGDHRLDVNKLAARYKNKTEDKDGNVHYEYSERQVQHRNREKAKRIEGLKSSMPKLQSKVKKDLGSSDPKTKLTALAVALMDVTYERIGNDGSAADGHYGVTGWESKHVSFGGKGATISYTGKSGVKQKKTITDPKLVSALKEAVKAGGDKVLSYDCPDGDACVSPSDVNNYLSDFGITAKDIRGYHANDEMLSRLRAIRDKGPGLPTERKERDDVLKQEFEQALEEAANIVGHEPSTLSKDYLVPGLKDSYMKDGTVMESFLKSGAEVGTDTATIIAIAPEMLRKLLANPEFLEVAESWAREGAYLKWRTLIQQHGGAVFETGWDGSFNVKIDPAPPSIREHGLLPPYGTPEFSLTASELVRMVRATKTRSEKEEEQAEDLVRKEPPKKPPREDLRKRRIDDEDDPDLKKPNATNDRDLSHNYKGRNASELDNLVALFLLSRHAKKEWWEGKKFPHRTESGETRQVAWKSLTPEEQARFQEQYDQEQKDEAKKEPAQAEPKPKDPRREKGDAAEGKRQTFWKSPTMEGLWIAQDAAGDTRAFKSPEEAEAFATGEKKKKPKKKQPKKKQPKDEPEAEDEKPDEPEETDEQRKEREEAEKAKAEAAEQVAAAEKEFDKVLGGAGLPEDVREHLTERFQGMDEDQRKQVIDEMNARLTENTGMTINGDIAVEMAESSGGKMKAKDLPKDPKELGRALADRAYTQNVVLNPMLIGGKAVSDGSKSQGELSARAKAAFDQYQGLKPEHQQDAATKLNVKLKEVEPDSNEAKELNAILNGVALAAALRGNAVEGRPPPSGFLTSIAEGLERRGDVHRLLDVMDPEFGGTRQVIRDGIQLMDDKAFVSAVSDSPLLSELGDRLTKLGEGLEDKGPLARLFSRDKHKQEIRQFMEDLLIDDLTFVDPIIRDGLDAKGNGKDALDQKKRAEIRDDIHKEAIGQVLSDEELVPDDKDNIRMGLLESAIRKVQGWASNIRSQALGQAESAVQEKNLDVLEQKPSEPLLRPAPPLKSDVKEAPEPKGDKKAGQWGGYTPGQLSEGPGPSVARGIHEPELPRRNEMTKLLTLKGAEQIQDHSNRLAHVVQNNWQELGIPSREHALDLAFRLDLLGDTVAKKAATNDDYVQKRLAAGPKEGESKTAQDAPTVAPGTIKNDDGAMLAGGKPAEDNRETTPNGYNPADIGAVKPPERQDADEPYMDAFTQDEYHQLADLQQKGMFSNSKAAASDPKAALTQAAQALSQAAAAL